ncbi:MAG: hypothetical protein WC759_01105 [Candidatus Micrarchaeia archaeon]|jgi:hypothetical protein
MPNETKPERANRLQIAALVLIVAIFIAFMLLVPGAGKAPVTPEPEEQQISSEQFEATVLGSQRIVIVMDLRDSPSQNSSNAIMQCGINLAFSISQLNKTIDSYAYDRSNWCYSASGINSSIAECERLMPSAYRFVVGYGAGSTAMYRNRTLISTNEHYGSACSISIEQSVSPEPPWLLVDPNATAKTANKTQDQIFSECLAREACTADNAVPEIADACLRSYALTIGGDPHCCFGMSTADGRNSCILSTAGITHGISADYCQFLPSEADRDACYLRYGENYLYFAYCDRITNSSMKATCIAELSQNGALPSQIGAKIPKNSS